MATRRSALQEAKDFISNIGSQASQLIEARTRARFEPDTTPERRVTPTLRAASRIARARTAAPKPTARPKGRAAFLSQVSQRAKATAREIANNPSRLVVFSPTSLKKGEQALRTLEQVPGESTLARTVRPGAAIFRSRAVEPVRKGFEEISRPSATIGERGMGVLQATVGLAGATPLGFLTNVVETGVGAGVRTARGKGDFQSQLEQVGGDINIGVGESLGLEGAAAFAVNLAFGNPKAALKALVKAKNLKQFVKLVQPKAITDFSGKELRRISNIGVKLDKGRNVSIDDLKFISDSAVAKLRIPKREVAKLTSSLEGVNDLVSQLKVARDIQFKQPIPDFDQFKNLVSNIAEGKRPSATITGIVDQPTRKPLAKINQQIAKAKQTSVLQAQQAQLPKAKQQSLLKNQGLKTGTVKPSLDTSIPEESKYAFNLNKKRLGLKGEDAARFKDVVEQIKPVLSTTRGKKLTNDEIIEGARKANILDEVVGREQAKQFSERLQASRNFLAAEAKKPGVTPEFIDQLEVVSSQAADAGRRLRAFAVDAQDTNIKTKIIQDLNKLGVEADDMVKAAKDVDWNNAKQVTDFYRKFKPAKILERLDEFRYTNMLSSPNTHINNAFSNFIQTGVIAPVEKSVAGALDFARSRITGSEQKYFARQGIDYTKGYWKALPEAVNNFRRTFTGASGLTKPDVDFIPTSTSTIHRLYTTPLRALEASDQFFKTLTEAGEKGALKLTGLKPDEIAAKASRSAEYRLFRQKFDPEGKLGQNAVLQVFDKYNQVIGNLRRNPGGKWLLPFLQTPVNILKQGIEYSPLGLATVKGAEEPMVQLAKTAIGSSVFGAAFALADSGLTTFDAPVNAKERAEFFAAGLQPYSIKIGDKWVSYSKLGPLAYPIAMASSVKWAQDNGLGKSEMEKLMKGSLGFLRFFSDQSYVKNIGDIVEAVQGGENQIEGSAKAMLSNFGGQLVPYRSFVGWINRLVDPVYRKAETLPQKIFKDIPGVSQQLQPFETPTGEPSVRQMPILNALSPVRVTQEANEGIRLYNMARNIRKTKKASKLESDERKEQAENLYEQWKELPRDEANSRAKELKAQNPKLFKELKQTAKDAKNGLTYEDRLIKSLGVSNGDRANFIFERAQELETREEKNAYIKDLKDKGVISKSVLKQIKRLAKEQKQ